MELTDIVARSWGWTGIQPLEVVSENDFGNLIVRDVQDQYWRVCPEDLYCKIVATDRTALDALRKDQEFQQDWNMDPLVEEARTNVGSLERGRKYCLKIPGLLGGAYAGHNLASISLIELIQSSGDVAFQLKDLPEGSQVQFRIGE